MMIDVIPGLSSDEEVDLVILIIKSAGKLTAIFPCSLLLNGEGGQLSIALWLDFRRKKSLSQPSVYRAEDGLEASGDIELPENAV